LRAGQTYFSDGFRDTRGSIDFGRRSEFAQGILAGTQAKKAGDSLIEKRSPCLCQKYAKCRLDKVAGKRPSPVWE